MLPRSQRPPAGRVRPGSALPGTRRPRILALLLLAFLCQGVPAPATGTPQVPEYALKAEFLVRFLGFAEWPSADRDPSAPLVIGVIGEDPFGELLEARTRDRRIAGRTLEVRRLRDIDSVAACDILFVAENDVEREQAILRRARGAGALTVGERKGFARAGGVIEFFREEGRVRFEINPEAARAAGIQLSSQLLRLARITDGVSVDGGAP